MHVERIDMQYENIYMYSKSFTQCRKKWKNVTHGKQEKPE
jgi:hypothetical protein